MLFTENGGYCKCKDHEEVKDDVPSAWASMVAFMKKRIRIAGLGLRPSLGGFGFYWVFRV